MWFAATKLHIFKHYIYTQFNGNVCNILFQKNKALIAGVLTVAFKLFKDVTKNPSEADDSGSKKQ